MSKILTNKESLLKNGYCIVRNLLNNKEVEKAKSIINKISKTSGKKLNTNMFNYRESWELFTNDRLLNIVKDLLGPDIFFLHTCLTRRENEKDINYTWHRDNPCRLFGKGPDWDKKEPYNVLSIIIYLSSSETTGSGINLIPSSHKKTYTLSNILRVLHFKTKYISILKSIRDLFPKYLVGVNIKTEPGDCVVFFANLLHTGIPTHGLRKAIIFQYGTDNKHSKNFVNYSVHHRPEQIGYETKYKDKINEFFNFLKSKNIFYPLPEKKIEIKEVSIPKNK
jgi:ectoine hydroxylase-related dioxygenase (phytanoyl-CoA dioxygenase family)